MSKTKKERVGLYGGSFNPPTKAHVAYAEMAIKEFNLDKLIIMPAGTPPHKQHLETSATSRFELSKLAFKDIKGAIVSDLEVNKKEPCYTVDTLVMLKEIYPDADLVLIIGSDTAGKLLKWKSPDKLPSLLKEIDIFQRAGEDCTQLKLDLSKLANKINIVTQSDDYSMMSSTLVRSHIAQGHTPHGLVTPEVLSYITEHNFYQHAE